MRDGVVGVVLLATLDDDVDDDDWAPADVDELLLLVLMLLDVELDDEFND